jgi:hypothetical protein
MKEKPMLVTNFYLKNDDYRLYCGCDLEHHEKPRALVVLNHSGFNIASNTAFNARIIRFKDKKVDRGFPLEDKYRYETWSGIEILPPKPGKISQEVLYIFTWVCGKTDLFNIELPGKKMKLWKQAIINEKNDFISLSLLPEGTNVHFECQIAGDNNGKGRGVFTINPLDYYQHMKE